MGIEKDRKRFEKLAKEIAQYDQLYFVENKPAISDFEYDCLKAEYLALIGQHPEWTASDKVGSDLKKDNDTIKTIPHLIPMLSLTNTYSREEIESFETRVKGWLNPSSSPAFVIEPKIDGMAISLVYENGQLVRALTRGDGNIGEDISRNIEAFHEVPLNLEEPHPQTIEIRGEIYIPKSDFERLNREQEESGFETYANTRNLASGSVKLLDVNEAKKRSLHFLAYGVGHISSEFNFNTQFEITEWLQKEGFTYFQTSRLESGIENIWNAIKCFDELRKQFPYVTDGVVIKINDCEFQKRLGNTAKAPRWAIAYKFEPENAQTILREITFQVGRTGVITPVAELEPIFLAGSTISRATLHNVEELKRKDVHIGDTVIVQKAGEVIPYIFGVLHEKRLSTAPAPLIPPNCPACNTQLIQLPGEVALRCTSISCPAQTRLRIVHFASLEAMDIQGLGPALVDRLVTHGLVKDISDIFELKNRRLALFQLERLSTKSIDKLLGFIESAKTNDLYRLVYGLGIPHVGVEIAKNLANNFSSLDELSTAKPEELGTIDLVGETIANAVYDFFRKPIHQKILETLRAQGVNFLRHPKTQGKWPNTTFVLTGTLQTLTRTQAKNLIERNGGRVVSNLTRNTNFIIAGENPGQKLLEAQQNAVPIWDESTFLKHLADK